MLPLLMKPTGQIDFVFNIGLVVCLRDDREDGELQVSYERSLRLQLATEKVQSLLFLPQLDTIIRAFQRRFFDCVSDKSIIEIQFFKTA